MLRLIGFFVLVFAVMQLLRHVPGVGALFRVPIIGFWGTAILVSMSLSWLASRGLLNRRLRIHLRNLGAVETPHNQGKLGTLLQQSGRNRRAIAPLEQAVEGDPGVAEWPYRLGLALLESGVPERAAEHLAAAAVIEEEHAYGQVMLRLAEAQHRSGRPEEALSVLERFEHNHGASPEYAYRKGRALASLGRKDEARASYAEAGRLASRAVGFQKRDARAWALRAFFARLV